ncbi:MAG: hypothetical protein K8H88_02030, partial [Sandaracinaceae bacterium]|nr:hypothetical protein [Sandaracinaceae bacterium]
TQEPVWARALRARGLSDRKLRAVREADEALRKTELPPLDDDVSPTHAELFQQLAAARRHADRVLAPAAMSASQLTWTRISRFAVLGAAALIAILAFYFAVRTPDETTAIASAVYANHADYQPEMAIDGDPESEWLLPDHQTGWLEVRLSPPERVGTLRLRNTHNRQYNDRATKDYTVEIYSGGAVVRTIQGTWPRLVPNDPPWTEHQVGVDNVERIRFVVRSSHNYGGGLAEIEWR